MNKSNQKMDANRSKAVKQIAIKYDISTRYVNAILDGTRVPVFASQIKKEFKARYALMLEKAKEEAQALSAKFDTI